MIVSVRVFPGERCVSRQENQQLSSLITGCFRRKGLLTLAIRSYRGANSLLGANYCLSAAVTNRRTRVTLQDGLAFTL